MTNRSADLLDYLERYRSTPRRRVVRVERWRRRGWTRGQIAATADALATELHERGVGVDDRVGIYVKDGPLWAAALFGTLRAGAVAVPFDVAHPIEVIEALAAELDLAAWIGDAELPALRGLDAGLARVEVDRQPRPSPGALPPRPPRDPSRIAEVVLTSGTTGMPTSVAVRHENMRSVLDSLEHEIARYRLLIRVAPRLRLAIALPLSHLYGQFMGALLPVALDADVAMFDTMPASELAGAIRRERAWAFVSVPHTLSSLLEYLLDEERRERGGAEVQRRLDAAVGMPWLRRWRLFDGLRRRVGRRLVAVVSGGASLDPDVERLWKLLGYVVVQGYGLTEAAPLVTLNHPMRPRQGSVGKPLSGVEVRLAPDGEILVRGPNVATPSARGPQIDTDGWLHTGDFGELLDDGSIGFRGRGSDRIVTAAGVNVDPGEVAAALRADERCVDAVVVEQPGAAGTLCAVLVVFPGTDVDALVREVNAGLADAARVRSWFVWPRGDLPRTPTGKVRRGDVVAWLEAQASATTPDIASATAASAIERVLGALTGAGHAPEAGSIPREATIGELLSSLERVELAGRLEQLYGAAAGEALFSGERTIEEVASMLRSGGHSRHADSANIHTAERESTPSAPTAATASGGVEPPTDQDPRRTTTGDPVRGRYPGAAPAEPDPAPWRHNPTARVARWALRECVMFPLAHLLIRIEADVHPAVRAPAGPFLLAANHTSPMDPVIQFALPRRVRARLAPAARWSFFAEHRIGRRLYFWSVLGLNVFPLVQVGDWRVTLRVGGELADRGHSILIYPEGEISKDGAIHGFQQGVAVMSRDLHLPIVPSATAGLADVLPHDRRMPKRDSWRRPRIGVSFGEPMPAVRPGDDLAAAAAELERRVRALHDRARALATGAHQA